MIPFNQDNSEMENTIVRLMIRFTAFILVISLNLGVAVVAEETVIQDRAESSILPLLPKELLNLELRDYPKLIR